MSGPSSGSRTRPSGAKVVTAFTVGLLVGAGLVFPVLPSTVELLFSSGGSFGTVGKMLLAGVLLLFLVVVGFMTLFQIFVLIDW